MTRFSKREIWVFAITTSLLLHVALVFFIPTPHKQKELPVMTVRFTTLPAAAKKTESPKLTEPKKEIVKQNDEKTRPIEKPKPKIKTKPAEKLPEISVEKTEPTTKPITIEVSKTAVESSFSKETADHSLSNESDTASSTATTGGVSDTSTSKPENSLPVDAFTLRITKKVIPEYSSFSRKRKEEGTVKIIITIDNGRVTKAEIEKSSGHERLDESALRAARQWLFDYDGKIKARLPIVFKLQ